jgi:hypothetical protein
MHKASDTLTRDGFKAQGRKGKGVAELHVFSHVHQKLNVARKLCKNLSIFAPF